MDLGKEEDQKRYGVMKSIEKGRNDGAMDRDQDIEPATPAAQSSPLLPLLWDENG